MVADREQALERRLEELRVRLSAPPGDGGVPSSASGWAWTPSPSGYARAVAACVERIAAGDLYQANLTMRLEARLEGTALDLFTGLSSALPTDRGAFVSGPWGALVSVSPELFLERHGRSVRSAPIKGTRPRPADPVAASEQRAALVASDKDRAENVMIVDLVRNDLGRVCRPGTVRAAALAGGARARGRVAHGVGGRGRVARRCRGWQSSCARRSRRGR